MWANLEQLQHGETDFVIGGVAALQQLPLQANGLPQICCGLGENMPQV